MPAGHVHDFPGFEFPYPLHDLIATVAAPACALSDRDGQIRPIGAQGLYVVDARVLRCAQLTVDGRPPVAIGTAPAGPNATDFHAVVLGIGDNSPDPTVRLTRRRLVAPEGMTETIRLSSTAQEPVYATIAMRL